MSTYEYTGGKPQYKLPSHFDHPTDAPIYFLPHHINWLIQMPDLLLRDCNTLEIGALHGAASCFMLDKYCKKTGKHMIIDINVSDNIDNNLAPYAHQTTYMLGESGDMMRILEKESVDLVYIDGSHMAKNVLEDSVNAFYTLKNNGYIVWDDYGWGLESPKHCQPKTGIDAFIHAYGKYLKIKSVGWQVIAQKVSYDMSDEEKRSNYVKIS